MFKPRTKPVSAANAAREMMTEEQLGECVRDACAQLGWQFYWLRKTMYSSAGILDLLLVPVRVGGPRPRRILHRELKGYSCLNSKRTLPRLGTLSDEQKEAIRLINAAGGDAALWEPADWFSGRILKELQ